MGKLQTVGEAGGIPERLLLFLLLLAHMPTATFAYKQHSRGGHRASFTSGQSIPLYVDALRSSSTLIPLDVYQQLPDCAAPDTHRLPRTNLGQILQGTLLSTTEYNVEMKFDRYCDTLCVVSNKNNLASLIHQNYHAHYVLDGIPVGTTMGDDTHNRTRTRYFEGVPLGYVDAKNGTAYVYNHYNFKIVYHRPSRGRYELVRFTVQPFSIQHHGSSSTTTTPFSKFLLSFPNQHTSAELLKEFGAVSPQPATGNGVVTFTYDILWDELISDQDEWALRFEGVLPVSYQWVQKLVQNSVLCLVLVAVLVIGVVANLSKEQNKYHRLDGTDSDTVETSGWVAIRNDVFRPPQSCPTLFVLLCSTGIQLTVVCLLVVILAAQGTLRPAHPGRLLTAVILLFAVTGGVAGYVSATLTRAFRFQPNGRRMCLLTAGVLPGIAFAMFLFINAIEQSRQSTKSVPLLTLTVLMLLWVLVLFPTVCIGSSIGNQCSRMEFPYEPSKDDPRPIPESRTFALRSLLVLLRFFCFDSIVFLSLFSEIDRIMLSCWTGSFYFTYSFQVLLLLVGFATSAFAAVVVTHFKFRREDYQWWWSSLTTAGAIGFYFFLFSIYYAANLNLSSFASLVIYFGYMLLVSMAMTCMFGSVGVLASLAFSIALYSGLLRSRPSIVVEEDIECVSVDSSFVKLSRTDTEEESE